MTVILKGKKIEMQEGLLAMYFMCQNLTSYLSSRYPMDMPGQNNGENLCEVVASADVRAATPTSMDMSESKIGSLCSILTFKSNFQGLRS